MISIKYQNAMAEVLWYLNGIKEDDVEKIPKEIMNFIKENASNKYKCSFDCNRPLKELNLLKETRGIIGMLCYKYWCIIPEQKEMYLQTLSYNEKNFQEKIKEKYNVDNLFKRTSQGKDNINIRENNLNMIVHRESIFVKIMAKIKHFWRNI